jgi:hypothetical protein
MKKIVLAAVIGALSVFATASVSSAQGHRISQGDRPTSVSERSRAQKLPGARRLKHVDTEGTAAPLSAALSVDAQFSAPEQTTYTPSHGAQPVKFGCEQRCSDEEEQCAELCNSSGEDSSCLCQCGQTACSCLVACGRKCQPTFCE